LRPDCRRSGLGRLLSLGRFLFMARFPARFGQETLAELRGYLNEIGQSPFWESVGRPFFEREFTEADFLSGLGNKSFIRDLMPRHPLYTALLPTGAREVIGRVHNDTRPAKALLEAEGFASINEVDIFDAGPVLQAETSHLRSVRETRPYLISECGADAELPVKSFHAANGRLEFRACLARARVESPSSCVLSQSAAQLLGLSVGDTVYLVSARPDGV
jgi:arginine N-succinyltransferase